MRGEAEEVGLVVESSEGWTGETRFADVTALVRYFAFAPWEVPREVPGLHGRQLATELDLHRSGRDQIFTQRRFYLGCRR